MVWLLALSINFYSVHAASPTAKTPEKKVKVVQAKSPKSRTVRAKLPSPEPSWKQVELRLKKAKFTPKFIKTLRESYEPDAFHEVTHLNVLLYLKKSDYHGPQVSDEAVEEVREFLSSNARVFKESEAKFKIPASTIASLLYLESRFGANKGRFHVLSVFLHLLQVDRPEVVELLKKEAKTYVPRVTPKIAKEIKQRSIKKSQWALTELQALAKMYERNSTLVTNLKGSFSGAFGMPQFIPSSYVRWAKPASYGLAPDLNNSDDAIHSVAFYLKDNGWRGARNHVKALMKYNNSRDYAMAILDLAKRADSAEKEDSGQFSTNLLKKTDLKREPSAIIIPTNTTFIERPKKKSKTPPKTFTRRKSKKKN